MDGIKGSARKLQFESTRNKKFRMQTFVPFGTYLSVLYVARKNDISLADAFTGLIEKGLGCELSKQMERLFLERVANNPHLSPAEVFATFRDDIVHKIAPPQMPPSPPSKESDGCNATTTTIDNNTRLLPDKAQDNK